MSARRRAFSTKALVAVAAAAVVAFSGAVLLEPSSKRRWLLSGEKKRPEGFDWIRILLSQNSGSENRSERSRTNRVARDRGSKVQFCAPNSLSMAAMSAACVACCGTRLLMVTCFWAAESHVSKYVFQKTYPTLFRILVGYVFQKNILIFLTGKVCFRGYVFEKMQIVGAESKPDFKNIPPKTYP
jgi:hypothetical protein